LTHTVLSQPPIQRERDDLGAEQADLRARRQLDAVDADRGHHHDPDHPDERDGERRVRRALPAEEQEAVETGDLRQVGHDDDVGDDDAQPAIHPLHGPIARVTHENVVPQSGSARFM
jgi:hypothetical protein